MPSKKDITDTLKKADVPEVDFNKLVNESVDFLLILVKKSDSGELMFEVSMKFPHSIIASISTILVDNQKLRDEVMSQIMALEMAKKDKTIN